MKAPPLLFGGKSPIVAYLRHSMMVWYIFSVDAPVYYERPRTVLPEPLYPTIRVNGVYNWIVSGC